jgi:hypothetical protein
MIDKNKLKEKIQRTPSKDLLYLTVNPFEPKSLQAELKKIEKYVGKDEVEIVLIKKRNQ